MKREEIETLKEKVGCSAVLETAGFAIDIKESTKRAIKYRRGSEIIIVTHEGRGWFDPLGEDKGDVFSLVIHLDRVDFHEGFERVANLVGFQPSQPAWRTRPSSAVREICLPQQWGDRRKPWPGSATWRYLVGERQLPAGIVRSAIESDNLREGPQGSMWAAHRDVQGSVVGWEARGPEWRGFATGGAKVLFCFGSPDGWRLCVTEAAIDAMSLAALEDQRDGTLYLSTGGGWSPATDGALRLLARRPDTMLVAATDANAQGDAYARRLRLLAEEIGCDWQRLRPPADDWNEALKERKKKGRKRDDVPHARQPRQGRLRPAKAGP